MLSYQFALLSLLSVFIGSAKPLAGLHVSPNSKSADISIVGVNDDFDSFGRGYTFSDFSKENITLTRNGDNSIMTGSISDLSQQFQIECQTLNSDAPVGKWTGLCVRVGKSTSNSNLSAYAGHALRRDEGPLPATRDQQRPMPTTGNDVPHVPQPTQVRRDEGPLPATGIQQRAVGTGAIPLPTHVVRRDEKPLAATGIQRRQGRTDTVPLPTNVVRRDEMPLAATGIQQRAVGTGAIPLPTHVVRRDEKKPLAATGIQRRQGRTDIGPLPTPV